MDVKEKFIQKFKVTRKMHAEIKEHAELRECTIVVVVRLALAEWLRSKHGKGKGGV